MKKHFKIINIPGRKILFALFFSAISMSWMGCEKDYSYIPPPPDPTVPVSFSADIFPLFSANCNSSSCHLNNANSPDLSTVAIAYAQMWVNDNGTVLVDTSNGGANAELSELYIRMNSSSDAMPPAGNLPAEQIALVLTWIQQGAKNN